MGVAWIFVDLLFIILPERAGFWDTYFLPERDRCGIVIYGAENMVFLQGLMNFIVL